MQGGTGSARHGKVLDPRGMFVCVAKNRAWLWVGNKVLPGNHDAYK
jgi:hypothetical protein